MSLRDILETAQAISLASVLAPDEEEVWKRYCRTYSKTFSEPLTQVLSMDPLTVFSAVFSDQLDEWNIEEKLPEVFEIIYSLQDRDYDIKKERAIREEMRLLEEREAERIRDGRAVHSSLEKDKRVIAKEQPIPKDLPKSGGLNMNAINRLNSQDKEG